MMKPFFFQYGASFFFLAFASMSLSKCGSPLVGNACKESLSFCDQSCVDLSQNKFNCGYCGRKCDRDYLCFHGECVLTEDQGLPGGRGLTGGQGGFDSSMGGLPSSGGDEGGGDSSSNGGFVDLGGKDNGDGGQVVGGDMVAGFEENHSGGQGGEHAHGGDFAGMGGFSGFENGMGGLNSAGFNMGGSNWGGSLVGGDSGGQGGQNLGGAGGDNTAGLVGCDIGQTQCGEMCASLATSFEHCGECFLGCNLGQVCAGGECGLSCEGFWQDCGEIECVHSQRNPDHCGACNNSCDSGICRGGVCVEESIGHLIVMGHDFSNSRRSMQQILGNAVFLHPSNTVRVLSYEAYSDQDSVRGVFDSIESVRVRPVVIQSVEDSSSVPILLENHDVFLIQSQHGAVDEILRNLGESWAIALQSFLSLGGVVILLDGGGEHSGTFQILEPSGLFFANGRENISGEEVEVISPGDAIALNVVALEYRAESNSVSFDTEVPPVVQVGDHAVVIHTIILGDD